MIFEVINPSDPVVFETENFEAAAVACVIVGEGRYGLQGTVNDIRWEVPLFLFGGSDEWFTASFGHDLQTSVAKFMDTPEGRAELATVLESFMIGKEEDLVSYKKALELIPAEKQAEWRDHWKEQRRSSLNDICDYAWRVAKNLRKKKG
jgi:hypothetical protein